MNESHDLIIGVVEKGFGEKLTEAALNAGAGGVTLFQAKGRGLRERLGLIGQTILPEKEIVMIVCHSTETQKIFAAVVKAGGLEAPGAGIAYVIPVSNVVGLVPPFSETATEVE